MNKPPKGACVMSPFDVTEQRKADWEAAANTLQIRDKAYIDGKFVSAASGKVFECVNPATDAVLAMVAECDAADVDRAVKAARAAFESGGWSAMGPMDR
jgi:delta 1-pyrroline-5-carboxylate dehydrogenase